jgi:hypothetical protein
MPKEVINLIRSQSFRKVTMIAFPLNCLISLLSGIIGGLTDTAWLIIIYKITALLFVVIGILFIIARIGENTDILKDNTCLKK